MVFILITTYLMLQVASYILIIIYWCGYDHHENDKVILLSVIFIVFYF